MPSLDSPGSIDPGKNVALWTRFCEKCWVRCPTAHSTIRTAALSVVRMEHATPSKGIRSRAALHVDHEDYQYPLHGSSINIGRQSSSFPRLDVGLWGLREYTVEGSGSDCGVDGGP
ncbi:hypothetical protein PV04_03378 [Phialophora macrospora]|uniref:Uncharacterized protein n=1 Tax=Phialophora macrospora TaxID=1851006 RepID=A0A0D2EA39_9EURO|nr:hypothetical protein PV04_03378 [Phialophora macrospora]